MALTPKLSNAAASAECNALAALLDGGFLDIYDGVQPATADTSITTQNLLASLQFATPAFGAAVNGVAISDVITPDASADASGTASWYRCFSSDHTTVVQDGSIGTSGANLNLNSVAISIGAEVALDSFTLITSKS
jgi:hypothetical protein